MRSGLNSSARGGTVAPPRRGADAAWKEEGWMAEVAVDERRLLKTMRWWDGFVIGLANPGFLIIGLWGQPTLGRS